MSGMFMCKLCGLSRPRVDSVTFGPCIFCDVCIEQEKIRCDAEWEQALGHPPLSRTSREGAARILAGRWFGFSVTTEEREQQAQDDRLFAEDHSWASDNRGLSAPEHDDDFGTFRSGE